MGVRVYGFGLGVFGGSLWDFVQRTRGLLKFCGCGGIKGLDGLQKLGFMESRV